MRESLNRYRIIAQARTEKFYNLSQVYGFLVGVFADYRKHHRTVKDFKRWYLSRRRRGVGDKQYTFEPSITFQIEKLTASSQRSPHVCD